MSAITIDEDDCFQVVSFHHQGTLEARVNAPAGWVIICDMEDAATLDADQCRRFAAWLTKRAREFEKVKK